MKDLLVWLAQHPAVWVLALGVLCSLLYTWLDRYPAAHAVFRVLAAALPGDVTAIRRAVLLLVEQQLAAKAGVDPVTFAARRQGSAPHIAVPADAGSFPPVTAHQAQFPATWEPKEPFAEEATWTPTPKGPKP